MAIETVLVIVMVIAITPRESLHALLMTLSFPIKMALLHTLMSNLLSSDPWWGGDNHYNEPFTLSTALVAFHR